MNATPGSPYEVALGSRLHALHPRLRAYFGAIPAGGVGRGHGVFERVGTPRRWLWPVLGILARQGIAFPVWAADVPFDVENRPIVDAAGRVAVVATRTFHFSAARGGTRTMRDAITAEPRGLVDHLGPARLLSADLEARVEGGALTMTSRAVAVRIGRWHARILGFCAPRVDLTERFDDERDRQHVSIVLSVPVIGRIYEYSGYFEYEVFDGAVTAGREDT